MQALPCHPIGAAAGGIQVVDDQILVFDPLTDEPRLNQTCPEACGMSAANVLTAGVLSTIFPDQHWYLGKPYQAEIALQVENREAALVRGTISVPRFESLWSAKLDYSVPKPRWRYEVLETPPGAHEIDVVLLGRLIEAVHGLHTSGGTGASLVISNLFSGPDLPFVAPDWLFSDVGSVWALYSRLVS